jgi:hypothetical protein
MIPVSMYLHLVINIDNVPIIQTHRVYVGGKRNRPNITADVSSNNQPNNPTSIGNSISKKARMHRNWVSIITDAQH